MKRIPHPKRVGRVQIREQKRTRMLKERIKKKAEAKPRPEKHTEPIRVKPLTSEYELEKTRTEINAINRRRAKEMERRVAKFLKGNRVPASGAMMGMKGDCYIPLVNSGQYLVECKLSAHKAYDAPTIILDLRWFDKILKDTKSMNARFGILVIHYHGMKEDYVFVDTSGMRLIAMHSVHGLTVDAIRYEIKPLDISKINNKTRSMYGLQQKVLENMFVTVRGFKAAAFIVSSGVWYVFKLSEFRDLMENV